MENDRKIEYIDINKLVPNAYNPNVQDDREFNALVESIRFTDEELVEPVIVHDKKDGTYEICGGEHRWKALRLLNKTRAPCIVLQDKDPDYLKFLNMKLNIIKGHIDPMRFTNMFNELSERFEQDILKEMMGFTDEAMFERLFRDITRQLPPEMQERLIEAKDEIKTIEDLSTVLNKLFKEYGDTLDKSYMFFM